MDNKGLISLDLWCLEQEKRPNQQFHTASGLYNFDGGADGDRTRYLFHAMEALSQVSYSPKCFLRFIMIELITRKVNKFSFLHKLYISISILLNVIMILYVRVYK